MCDGGWLLTVICIPPSYLTFTHDKPWIVTKDNLSQVLTSVVATAVNVISLAETVLSSSTLREAKDWTKAFFFRPVYRAHEKQFASSSQVHEYAFAGPLCNV